MENLVCYQVDCQHGWAIIQATFDKNICHGADGKWSSLLILEST